MNRTLLIGIIVVLGIAVTFFNPVISLIVAVGIWIYLVRMIRKQKKSVFKEPGEPEISERLLKRVNTFLILAGFSFLFLMVGAVVHNIFDSLSEMEKTVSFYIALVSLLMFVGLTAGGMVIFLKARQKAI